MTDDGPTGFDVTGFLIGNIDESDNLASEMFDLETQTQLAYLERLASASIVKEAVGEEKIQDTERNYGSQESQSQDMRGQNDSEAHFSQTYDDKSQTAKDFFDINEDAEDEYCDADDKTRNDKSLMPPPPLPSTMALENAVVEKPKLDTPLAAMLPSKYADVDATEPFSDSTHRKVVRFSQDKLGPKAAGWRFGPAQIWYDVLEVPETGEGFDYGFKIGDESIKVLSPKRPEHTEDNPIPDDAFLMVVHQPWQDDVVWNTHDIKNKVSHPSKIGTCNIWMPPTLNRVNSSKKTIIPEPEQDNAWYWILPVENEELVYGRWEGDVIWDSDNMETIPKPSMLTLDSRDENIIIDIPEDIDPFNQITGPPTPDKVKVQPPHVKKSETLLVNAGITNVLQEDTPPPPPKSLDRDPFNISGDIHYQPRTSALTMSIDVRGETLIQHSTPVVELRVPFIPTHMGPKSLRNFHRPPLKGFSHGLLSLSGPHSVRPLVKHIKKAAEAREQERMATGGGNVFFMRTAKDLTGRDGDIIMIEFCEEHPPLINQVGMCSKIKNYYKRKEDKDWNPPTYKYGETMYAHTLPFLGILQPGESIQTLENNMYRAPIYSHQTPSSDFLIIRTRKQYYIREIDSLFVAGQECPLYEVPDPNSRRSKNFVSDFLLVFIYRLFWKSRDNPRRIKMDDIQRVFPSYSASSIKKLLKICANLKKTSMDSNMWEMKPNFRLPTIEEIRAMVSPEQCCAYFSMLAAKQRLKDAGYGENFILTAALKDDQEMQLKMEEELKVAPWNTTRAYIDAMKGKCLLQLTGPADPTGCGEGFSYISVPNKPTQSKEEQESQAKRTLKGTDADLRKLSLPNAKAFLRKFGVPQTVIEKLSRWDIIDRVRTLSTEKAKAGEEGMDKFSRRNRFSKAEHRERYQQECQRIFELQNQVLASAEVLSTDEESSDDESDEDIEEMGKKIENMLANKKSSTQTSEEQERQELRKMMMEGDKERKEKKESQKQVNQQGKMLKIIRTFKNAEGKEYTRVEYVNIPGVIEAYIKIRTTNDERFIREFVMANETQKEEMKRQKRNIQGQLHRIKEKERLSMCHQHHSSHGEPTPKLKPNLKLKCGVCGQVGHKKTNLACPLYQNRDEDFSLISINEICGDLGSIGVINPTMSVALTEEQEGEMEKQLNTPLEDLVKVEGTKIKLSTKLIKQVEGIKRCKDAFRKKIKKGVTDLHCDSWKKPYKLANRRRTDPVVVLSSTLEAILNEMRDMPDVQPFLFPVNQKLVLDYYKIIQRPMDLQTIRENLHLKKYHNREQFLVDVNQIIENSTLYNGPKSSFTIAATKMLTRCVERLREKEDTLMTLERAINPLLDNDRVAFTYLLENIMNTKLKALSDSWPFHKPVNKKIVKDYYTIVKRPMDLETISKKIKGHRYYNRQDFQVDVEQILENCILYNGKDSPYTEKAELLVQACKTALDELDEHLTAVENKLALEEIKAGQEGDNCMKTDKEGYQILPGKCREKDYDFVDMEGGIQLDETLLTPKQPRKRFKSDEADTLQQDLLISSEDDLDVMTMAEFEPEPEQKGLSFSDDFFMNDVFIGQEENDEQKAFKAVVQLSKMGFYQQDELNTSETLMFKDESLDVDVDPNHDPSNFLMSGLASARREEDPIQGQNIHDDLAVSESEDEESHQHNQEMQQDLDNISEDDDSVWF